MKISVIGCGRWGTFIAYYLNSIGHDVTLYGRAGTEAMDRLLSERKNDYLTLPEKITLSTSLKETLTAPTIVISINSQGLRALFGEISEVGCGPREYVLCMKGIEIGTCKRLSEIATECSAPGSRVAVWIGPGHVQEFLRGTPNCMVIDSTNDEYKRMLVDSFTSRLIRFYYGTDIIGNEIGAASKNVIGIAAGMLDGFDMSALKGALMARGTREIARLISAMGGQAMSAYGLCHLGDYEATVFSPYSHNRRYGEAFVRGEKFEGGLAEGYYTAEAMVQLQEKYGAELPICTAVYDILYKGANPMERLDLLFSRSIKNEF